MTSLAAMRLRAFVGVELRVHGGGEVGLSGEMRIDVLMAGLAGIGTREKRRAVGQLTAEAMEPIQADFIPRAAFLNFLKEHGDAAVRVAEILSKIYHSTLLEVRYLGLFSSATEKLARFLLDLPEHPPDKENNKAMLTLTHREIGETIGASRETVTRLFADFKREGLVEVHGATVVFLDRNKLEKLMPG